MTRMVSGNGWLRDALAARSTAVFAAITAAGASRRMGAPKALLPWGGGTLLAAMIDAARCAGLAPPAVVFGADAAAILAEVERLGATPLWNPYHERGRFSSVRVAARWALDRASSRSALPALVLWPIDCPAVTTETLTALRREAAAHPRANIAPAYARRAGHPVVLCAETLAAVAAAEDDANLRRFVHEAPQGRRLVAVDDPAVLDNLNTAADYHAFVRARAGVAFHG